MRSLALRTLYSGCAARRIVRTGGLIVWRPINEVGYRAGVSAFLATVVFDVVQLLQVAGALRSPLDEILIYAASLCIVVPFVVEILALHHLTVGEGRFWAHAAVVFASIYAIFVSANYVVQLATVIPAKSNGDAASIALLEQTPHSMFWDYDAIGYIAMGFATLFAARAVPRAPANTWVVRALHANTIVTPLIAFVYFYPRFSTALLFVGFPWAITAPASMLTLALFLRRQSPGEPVVPS
jgi:hypothetical protein